MIRIRSAGRSEDCVVITNKEALAEGQHQSFDLGYVYIESVEAGYNANHDAAKCVGYLLTFQNDVTVYISGDTSTTPQMSELSERDIDYAFYCCDGIYNMGLEEAATCADLVGAAHSIPYHITAADGVNIFDAEKAEQFQAKNRLILAPGDTLKLIK